MPVFNSSAEFQNYWKYSVGLNEKSGIWSFPKAQFAEAVSQWAPIEHRTAMCCRKAILCAGTASNFYAFLCFFPMKSTSRMNERVFFS